MWLFYVLSALAIVGFAIGAYRNVSIWLRGRSEDVLVRLSSGFSRLFLDGLLNRRVFRGDATVGLIHISIMWGFIILFLGTVALTIHHDFFPYLFGWRYLLYSLVLDIAGLVMIVGVVGALLRRYVFRLRPMPSLLDDAFVLVALFIIGITGFAIEGLRLAALRPPLNDWSPIGAAFAAFLTGDEAQSRLLHGVLWWTHAIAALALVVYIPISKLFHMFASPANIYLAVAEPQVLTIGEREKSGGDFSRTQMVSLDACTKCNRCEIACPSHAIGEPLSPRRFVLEMKRLQKAKHGFRARFAGRRNHTFVGDQFDASFEDSAAWWCTMCMACAETCPVSIRPLDIIRERRVTLMTDGREVPPAIRNMLRTMAKYSNPWEASGSKRMRWRSDLNIKDLSSGDQASLCFWIGCIASEDVRNQEVTKAFIQVLRRANVDFGHLGKEEACCGEFIRRLGEDGLFESIVEGNYATFAAFGVSHIVTASPHCFHTMSREYPLTAQRLQIENAPELQIVHHTSFIADLIRAGRLSFARRLDVRVTFHDPCFIGRHNGLYDAPRTVLRAIPGVELVEMDRARANSFCCGGGGGRMWLESTAQERMAEVRVKEAVRTRAKILVTACPFCLSNLSDAVKTTDCADVIEVRDLAEVVATAL